jgi:hypothetical protein
MEAPSSRARALHNLSQVLEAIQISVRSVDIALDDNGPQATMIAAVYLLQRCEGMTSSNGVLVARTLPTQRQRFNAPLGKRLYNHVIFVMIDRT